MALRLGLMADQYRTDRPWTDDVLKTAAQRLSRWREAAAAAAGPSGAGLLAGVRARLADDLDTPGALALVDNWADAALAGSGDDPEAPALMASMVDALLGVRL
jgi:L-cysteine:1D-myo-inositol 2-amino-2-deoxy-alpha-D-glucopyranoside ligase